MVLLAALLSTLFVATVVPAPASAQQLDNRCVVSALNRTARVRSDGSWNLSNIPSDQGLIRIRATCQQDGETRTGSTDLLTVPANGFVEVATPIELVGATPIPERLDIVVPAAPLDAVGATAQLRVDALFDGGVVQDVTGSGTGIRYTVTNPAIATVDANGLVTAVASGPAIITAAFEGAIGLTRVQVVLSADSDGDGIPDDVEIANGLDPNDPIDGLEDTDQDGASNADELVLHGTDIEDPDSDDDGLLDGEEVTAGDDGFVTNPLNADTDGDQLRDQLEVQTNSDPTDPSSFNLAVALDTFTVDPTTIVMGRPLSDPTAEIFQQLTVDGVLIDGFPIDLTSTTIGTTYTSSKLTVCNFGTPDGRIFGGVEGTCTVTVDNAGFTTDVAVTVDNLPNTVSRIRIPGYANNVDVVGDFAFVAAGGTGLQVVDTSNPARPTIVASLPTVGQANDIVVMGTLALVAIDAAGLEVIDISDPLAPLSLGVVDTPGRALDVVTAGGFALVADDGAGLQVVDLANPAAPVIVGTLPIAAGARLIDTSYDAARLLAVVAVVETAPARGVVRAVDLSDPAAPVALGEAEMTGTFSIESVSFFGTNVVAGDRTSGVTTFDFADAANPTRLAVMNRAESGLLIDIAVIGDIAFGADRIFINSVPVLDLGVPTVPRTLGSINFQRFNDFNGLGIDADATYVYMTGSNSGSRYQATGFSDLFIGRYGLVEDNAGIPPTVSIVSPIDGATVFAGEPLVVEVDAIDDGAVASVTLLVDGEVVGGETSSPFAFEIVPPVGATSLTLSAVATDTGANTATAAPVVVQVVVNEPPSISITAPLVGETPREGEVVTIAADATDDGTVESVVFSVNGVPAFTDTTIPYVFDFPIQIGTPSLAIEAVATDNLGATASATRTVAVEQDPPPVIVITAPAPGASVVAEMPAMIAADVTDNSGIARVTFSVLGQAVDDLLPPFGLTVNVPAGISSFDLTVEAEDDLGRVSTVTQTVPVVPSAPPTVSLVTPVDGDTVTEGDLFDIVALAVDDVGVTSVDIAIDGSVVGTFSSPPFQVLGTIVPTGVSTLTVSVTATDTGGQTSTVVADLTVAADTPPTVTVTAPVDGTSVSAGSVVSVSANANDDIGVAGVRFRADGVEIFNDPTAPYGFDWTTPMTAGDVVIDAIAEDSLGQQTVSASVTVSVVAANATTVVGRVVDDSGQPLPGADVVCLGEVGSTAGDGSFSIADVPLAPGGVRCSASFDQAGIVLSGQSTVVGGVPGGTTDVGDLALAGSMLYGAGNGSFNSIGALFVIDQVTGEGTNIGVAVPAGLGVSGLAFLADGSLLGVTEPGFDADGGGGGDFIVAGSGDTVGNHADGNDSLTKQHGFGSSSLVVIDPDGGGMLALIGVVRDAFTRDNLLISDLAVDPISGTIYAVDDLGALFTLDVATADAQRIGDTGASEGGGLAFGPDGTLYQTSLDTPFGDPTLNVIDPVTAARISTLVLAAPGSDDYFDGLAVRGDGQLVGAAAVLDEALFNNSDLLYLIDPLTGDLNLVGGTGVGKAGDLAFRPNLPLDPGTTVTGRVIDEVGTPLAGLDVVCGGRQGVSQGDGTFAVASVPTVEGQVACVADGRDGADQGVRGRSAWELTNVGGTTDVGDVIARLTGGGLFPAELHHTGSQVSDVAIGDLNGDGVADIATNNRSTDEIAVLLGPGDGTFGAPVLLPAGNRPVALTLADLDLDGDLDIVSVASSSDDLIAHIALGGGTFSATAPVAVGGNPSDVAIGDVSGDGLVDAVVTDEFSDTLLLLGTGGGFQPAQVLPLVSRAMGAVIDDLNGDGLADVVLALERDDEVAVLLGTGGGAFASAVRYPAGDGPNSVAVADLTGDGLVDIGTTSSANDLVVILAGRGDGTFQANVCLFDVGGDDGDGGGGGDGGPVGIVAPLTKALVLGAQCLPVGRQPGALVAADLDGDGRVDLAVANRFSSDFSILRARPDGQFDAERRFGTGGFPTGIAVGDVNGDGIADIATANERSAGDVAVLLGMGDGAVESARRYVAGSEPSSIAIGDLDGDTVPDFVVTNRDSGDGTVFTGLGEGDFVASSRVNNLSGTPEESVLVDLDGDGILDFAAVAFFGNRIYLRQGLADGTFGPWPFGEGGEVSTGTFPLAIASGDFNGDGLADLASANVSGDSVTLLLNNGDFTFTIQTETIVGAGGDGPRDLAVGDFNGDGFDDIVTANRSSNNLTYLRSIGSASYQKLPVSGTGSGTSSVAIGDLTGDGFLDLAVGHEFFPSQISVIPGTSNALFDFSTTLPATATSSLVELVVADVDGDTDLDILAVSGAQDLAVFLNQGDGTFGSIQRYAAGIAPLGLAVADLDGDGRLDVIIANSAINLGESDGDVGVHLQR